VTVSWSVEDASTLKVRPSSGRLPEMKYSLGSAKKKCSSRDRAWHPVESEEVALPPLIGGDYRICLAGGDHVKFNPKPQTVFYAAPSASVLVAVEGGFAAIEKDETVSLDLPLLQEARPVSATDGAAYFVARDGTWMRGRYDGEAWVEAEIKKDLSGIHLTPT